MRILMIAGIAVIIAFIFFNSSKGSTASHQTSDIVIDAIAQPQEPEDNSLELIVRKGAHLVEYAALGIVVMLFVKRVEKERNKKLYAAAHFCVLLTAVIDEHLQSFSGRSSSTGDILLDFMGALIGFSIVLAVHFILTIRTRWKAKE